MDELKISYAVPHIINEIKPKTSFEECEKDIDVVINEPMEMALIELMDNFNYEFTGWGYDVITSKRDLFFSNKHTLTNIN